MLASVVTQIESGIFWGGGCRAPCAAHYAVVTLKQLVD